MLVLPQRLKQGEKANFQLSRSAHGIGKIVSCLLQIKIFNQFKQQLQYREAV